MNDKNFWTHNVRVNLVPVQMNRKAGYKQLCVVLTSRETGQAKELIYMNSSFNIRSKTNKSDSYYGHSWSCWTIKRELVNKAYFVKIEEPTTRK